MAYPPVTDRVYTSTAWSITRFPTPTVAATPCTWSTSLFPGMRCDGGSEDVRWRTGPVAKSCWLAELVVCRNSPLGLLHLGVPRCPSLALSWGGRRFGRLGCGGPPIRYRSTGVVLPRALALSSCGPRADSLPIGEANHGRSSTFDCARSHVLRVHPGGTGRASIFLRYGNLVRLFPPR